MKLKSLTLSCLFCMIVFSSMANANNQEPIKQSFYSNQLLSKEIADINKAIQNITTIEDILMINKIIDQVYGNPLAYTESQLLNNSLPSDTCDCPDPEPSFFKSICDSIAAKEKVVGPDAEYFEYGYEKRLFRAACIDVRKMDREEANAQLTKFWEKYKTKFKCDTTSSNVPNGNILKFAMTQSFPTFLETLVATYSADINFIDPADGLNVLEYMIKQMKKAEREQGMQHSRTVTYREYIELLRGLGALTTEEIKLAKN